MRVSEGRETDAAAFRELFDTYLSRVTAYARRRVESDVVDDVVVEVFLVAWR